MNLFENHVNRRNHVANAYHEVIYAKVINDKKSESIREEVKVEFKGLTLGRQNNIELGMCMHYQVVRFPPANVRS